MFKLEEVQDNKNHIIIRANEPIRLEIINTKSDIIIFGYKGDKGNIDQKPYLIFDTLI